MSDIGLSGSIYEQLRFYADKLDRALIALRNPQQDIAEEARREVVGLLREITDRDLTDPVPRLVSAILKQGLPRIAGQSLSLCEALAKSIEHREPTQAELIHLEQIALTLDKECSSTLARMKGK